MNHVVPRPLEVKLGLVSELESGTPTSNHELERQRLTPYLDDLTWLFSTNCNHELERERLAGYLEDLIWFFSSPVLPNPEGADTGWQ